MLNNIRIVLVETTHPGNIGATARAMKNMGLSELYLVAPKIFPDAEATALASGADDILDSAHQVPTLDEALAGCELVIGTSARSRALPMNVLSPQAGAENALKEAQKGAKVALVFGRESSGLTNDELRKSHYQIFIPTREDFSSLNLAQAVLLICYEVRLAYLKLEKKDQLQSESSNDSELASADQVEFFFEHLNKVLQEVEFLSLENKKLLLRIRRIFTRTRLEKREIDILRGILTAVERKI